MSLLCKRYELRGRNVMSRQVGVMILPAAKNVGRGLAPAVFNGIFAGAYGMLPYEGG